MQKFTIFTLMFSVMVVAVVSELIWSDYFKKPTLSGINQQAKIEIPFAKKTDTSQPRKEEKSEEKTKTPEIDFAITPIPKLTMASLTKTGLTNPNLKAMNFSGKLFQLLELAGVKNEEVVKNIISEGENYTGTIHEIHFSKEEATKELYNFLKGSSSQLDKNKVNESNSFGDNSFYININKNIVNLIIKIKGSIYGFEYPQKSHTKIKAIIKTLEEN